jgi:hypothetical protein
MSCLLIYEQLTLLELCRLPKLEQQVLLERQVLEELLLRC